MPDTPWRDAIDRIARDNRSGAAEITWHAIDALIAFIEEATVASAASYRGLLARLGGELIAAQPAMAPLFRLVNDMLWAVDGASSGIAMHRDALAFLRDYRRRNEEAHEALAGQAAEYLARYSAIMTYSRSSTVVRALQRLCSGIRDLRVYCGESRPMLEGQALARELAAAGARVTIGVDVALFGWLDDVEALVVGADALSAAGLVNKIGTAPLMRAAAERGLPRVVLCTTDKLLPEDYPLGRGLRSGPPEEVMPPADRIDVRNVYFDVTPLNLASVVITERGPLGRDALRDELRAPRTYPGLLEK